MHAAQRSVSGVPLQQNVRAPLGGTWQPRLEEKYSLGLTPSTLHRRELDTTLVLDTRIGLSASLLQVSLLRPMPKELPSTVSEGHWLLLPMPWHVQVGALQLKNNTSLLAEAQGVYFANLLLALQYLQPSLSWEESFSLQKG